MSFEGSPSTAIRSASSPGAMAPILSWRPQRLGGEGGGGDDRRHRVLPALLHPVDQLLEVAAVGAGHGVGAEDDLEPRRLQRLLEDRQRLRHRLPHLLEALVGEVADAQEVLPCSRSSCGRRGRCWDRTRCRARPSGAASPRRAGRRARSRCSRRARRGGRSRGRGRGRPSAGGGPWPRRRRRRAAPGSGSGAPPSRMLLEAKILITSAPWLPRRRTAARIFSGGRPVSSEIGSSEVRMRGPGRMPRAIESRRAASSGAPRLWTVVMPPRRVSTAFSAA